MAKKRLVNLDLFRAAAIVLVIYYHLLQMFFPPEMVAPSLYHWGKYGVEFFFVLSGFLVGGLFYKEKGPVPLFRFWLLRFFRTYPPYLVALALSFGAVWVARREAFDAGYLFFFQNFYRELPFFLVSWSLCVEEHFYVFFPLVILVSERLLKKQHLQLAFWVALALLPSLLRYTIGHEATPEFGYYRTATIFKFDGIALGCLLAFLVYRVGIKPRFGKGHLALALLLVAAALFANQQWEHTAWMYTPGYLVLNLSLLFLIAVCYFSADFRPARARFVFPLASMAYSLYLTHALVINLVNKYTQATALHPLLKALLALALILVTGKLFYHFIEQKTIRVRDRVLRPKRKASVAPAVAMAGPV